jgi:hypothetical protein
LKALLKREAKRLRWGETQQVNEERKRKRERAYYKFITPAFRFTKLHLVAPFKTILYFPLLIHRSVPQIKKYKHHHYLFKVEGSRSARIFDPISVISVINALHSK